MPSRPRVQADWEPCAPRSAWAMRTVLGSRHRRLGSHEELREGTRNPRRPGEPARNHHALRRRCPMKRLPVLAVLAAAFLIGVPSAGRADGTCPVSEFIGGNSADAFVPAGGTKTTTLTVTYHFTRRMTNP